MLKQLNIANIILVESASIPFEEGLNILSGETGSGKSAIMEALSQIKGAKADGSLVRHGAEKGVIEAFFVIDHLPEIVSFLLGSGIDHLAGEELLIRREISSSGKSRAFINNQAVHLTVLKKIGEHLVEIVSQHANQKLFDPGHHLEVLDLYGDLTDLKSAFEDSWGEENALKTKLQSLVGDEQKKLRELEMCSKEIEELEEGALKEGEEEELFAEYTRMNNAEELLSLSEETSGLFSEILSALNKADHLLDDLTRLDPSMQECRDLAHTAKIELDEASYTLSKKQASLDSNPEMAAAINARLTMINKLKKKYGPTTADALAYLNERKNTLLKLENSEVEIEELQGQIARLATLNHQRANELSDSRKKAAARLEKEITQNLQALNMPKAGLFIEITAQKRTKSGDDRVEFYLAPNTGEKRVSISDCASGGEISRLMLSLQTVLADKEGVPTLVFDEIDANIGGQTATVVGEKLRRIGENHQVLCITHFPQVARHAQHHLSIFKCEENGRTFTRVNILNGSSKEKELARMAGC